MCCVRSRIFVLVKLPRPNYPRPYGPAGARLVTRGGDPSVRFGSSMTQQFSTLRRVPTINHALPCISSAVWRPSSWTTGADLHLLASVATQFGQHRVRNSLHGKGVLSEQRRAPAQIISRPKRALVFPPPLGEA